MRTRPILVPTVAGLALITAACGSGSSGTNAAAGTRTVNIEMRDNAYSPDHVTVQDGETVRFMFHNTGAIAHDAFMGDAAAQDDHEMEMTGGGMHHDGTDAVAVDPGKTATLTHTFHTGDEVLIGCHQTGHYAAGMKITIDVG